MVDARAIDIRNALASDPCKTTFCTCFLPNCCCTVEPNGGCDYSAPGITLNRGFGYGSPYVPPPQACLCPDDYAETKLQGSKPCSRVISASRKNTNHLLVPVNVSKEYVANLYHPTDRRRYAAANELNEQPNNLTWRDGACDERTSTAEHLTAFADLVGEEADGHIGHLLDKYVPKRN